MTPKKEWLAVFDLDGTLYDTLPANHAAYADALAGQGIALSLEHFAAHCDGRHYRDFLPELLGARCTEALLHQVHQAKNRIYKEKLHLVRENAALFAMAQAMRPVFHLALVTTASAPNCAAVLGHFGRQGYFELVLTGADVPKPKPHPMGYTMAMQHFGLNAAHTVIFEDSQSGMAAARAATENVLQCHAYMRKNREDG